MSVEALGFAKVRWHVFRVANDHQAAISAAAERQLPRQWALLVAVWLFNELKANASPCRLRVLFNLLRSTAWRYWIYAFFCVPTIACHTCGPWLLGSFILQTAASLSRLFLSY